MKHIFWLLLFTVLFRPLPAQQGCVLQPPVYTFSFGGSQSPEGQSFSLSENYSRVFHDCPNDGHFALVSSTSDCFSSHWINVSEDHTPGDADGKMLLVNASYNRGPFFATSLAGLKPNTNYQLGAWVLNVCLAAFNCDPLRPSLRFIIAGRDGRELAKFVTGELPRAGSTSWLQYTANFTTPAVTNAVILKIETVGDGGCGNDFALDDITVRECVTPKSIVKEKALPVPKPLVKAPAPVTKNIIKPGPPAPKPIQKPLPVLKKVPLNDVSLVNQPIQPAAKSRPSFGPVPALVLSRANPVIKQIATPAAELLIDLYDNGEIDGDTVSIYHNNILIVSRALLSAKAITFRIKVDQSNPHHELVMVANNLGSIPPNTSLMIVTTTDKRYEVFISSSEQKNAKVVIDLKVP